MVNDGEKRLSLFGLHMHSHSGAWERDEVTDSEHPRAGYEPIWA